MRYSFSTILSTLFFLIGIAAQSRGEAITWKYNWSRSHAVIFADAPGTGKISLTDESLQRASGDSDIVATNIRVESTATALDPDMFTNAGYSLTLFLLDEESGNSGNLEFGGEFNGSISANTSNLVHTFSGATTQSIALGSTLYTVTIGPYTPPGPPSSQNSGAVSAFARVETRDIERAPEPSTIVLTAIAMPFFGIAAWRRKRRQL